jgi:hypothetical protein
MEAPADCRPAAADALARLDQRDLSWVGADGFPLSVPVGAVAPHAEGFRLQLGRSLPAPPTGSACLTFHTHPARFTEQENRTFVGDLAPTGAGGDGLVLHVARLLADVSLAGNKLTMTLGFLGKGRRLAPRLRSEAARRGQPVPIVRLPHEQ